MSSPEDSGAPGAPGGLDMDVLRHGVSAWESPRCWRNWTRAELVKVELSPDGGPFYTGPLWWMVDVEAAGETGVFCGPLGPAPTLSRAVLTVAQRGLKGIRLQVGLTLPAVLHLAEALAMHDQRRAVEAKTEALRQEALIRDQEARIWQLEARIAEMETIPASCGRDAA